MIEAGLPLATVALPEVRRQAGVELRRARLGDVDAIYWLIRYWAEKGLMLVRSHSHLYENIRDFLVLEDEDGHIVGTVPCTSSGGTWPRSGALPCTPGARGRASGAGWSWGRRGRPGTWGFPGSSPGPPGELLPGPRLPGDHAGSPPSQGVERVQRLPLLRELPGDRGHQGVFPGGLEWTGWAP